MKWKENFGRILWLSLWLLGGLFMIFDAQLFQGPTSAQEIDVIELNRQMQMQERFTDRRVTDGWYVMYPFGEIAYDVELLNQPNLDRQIDLDFYFPFYGFRFNYTFIMPNGIIAFGRPEYIQPPYTFPNPRWPERRDPSFIAPFFADATYQYVGETGISHVWYRTIHRPRIDDFGRREGFFQPQNIPLQAQSMVPNPLDPFQQGFQDRASIYGNVRRQAGYVEDNDQLDNITRDVQEGIIGAKGFRALHALVVTWERMAYGGAPKVVEVNTFNQVRRWQNTYQLILATDEIRSYVMFNYATINWTASNEAGALRGRGGMQAAIAGFNGGNGTGFTPLPYSGQGELFKLARYSSVNFPGRWVYRVDEQIIRGGCNNESIGYMDVAPNRATMLGGLAVNVSGPCFRDGDQVVVLFDEFQVNCRVINTGMAMCVLPKFHKVGLVNTKISRDGGMSFPYVGNFYIVQPDRSEPLVMLRQNALRPKDRFDNPFAERLNITWAPLNLTGNINSRVNIELWGFWEDTERSVFEKVGILQEGAPNNGVYEFAPSTLTRLQGANDEFARMWDWHTFGSIRVSVADDRDTTAGVFYSHLTPFSWYFLRDWEYEYGSNWASDMCIKWFEYDGRRRNFIMDLEPCPCVLDQALLDMGRFMPVFDCNMFGDSECPIHRGSQHCVQSVQASWTGAQQVCCYDFEGWLIHSDDYENADRLKYYSPGTPHRAHTFGSYPFKIPPYIPSLSSYMNDIMPYYMCCKYAEHCEFYFWRRQSSGCQGYRPPSAGFAYGDGHFITFDGLRYTFNGKGYYVLSMSDHGWNKLMIQIRMEQPPRTLWGTYPNSTVITGVVVQENDSDTVQILARKQFRRWRYRTDVLVRGIPRYFDSPEWKYQQFRGVNLYSPERNMNQSEVWILLRSGVGIRVQEAYGVLDVAVLLPPSYNMTYKFRRNIQNQFGEDYDYNDPNMRPSSGRLDDYYKTYGLLGVFNNDPYDDLTPPENGAPIRPSTLVAESEGELRMIYFQFGQRWKVDGSNLFIGPLLFQESVRPIYNPMLFSSNIYQPNFLVDRVPYNATLLFSMREVRDMCQENFACKFDYVSTGVREIALNTLSVEQKFIGLKQQGSKEWLSCGWLLKAQGAVKAPPGNSYLEGVTVTFTCKPDYFLHGTQQRTCLNGTWTPGWHVWCRDRDEEYALKWLTGILTSLAIIGVITAIFCCCYMTNVRPRKARRGRQQPRQGPRPGLLRQPEKDLPPPPSAAMETMTMAKFAPPDYDGSMTQYDREPKAGINGNTVTYSQGPRVHLHQTTSA